jgi:hypothetical protein
LVSHHLQMVLFPVLSVQWVSTMQLKAVLLAKTVLSVPSPAVTAVLPAHHALLVHTPPLQDKQRVHLALWAHSLDPHRRLCVLPVLLDL